MKLILMICFTIALIFLPSSQNIFAQKEKASLSKALNYCSLFNSTQFDEKNITTETVLYIPADGEPRVDGASDEFFYSTNCNNRDYFAKANFDQVENLKLIRNKLKTVSDKNLPIFFRVVITGKLSLSFIPTFGHLNWLRAEIKVKRLESVKPVKGIISKPDSKSFSPIFTLGNSLKYTNSEVMFSFYRRGSDNSTLENVLSENTKIIINKKPAKVATFLELTSKKQINDLAITIDNVIKTKDLWTIKGILKISFEDQTKVSVKYDNKYVFRKDKNWKLVGSNINY